MAVTLHLAPVQHVTIDFGMKKSQNERKIEKKVFNLKQNFMSIICWSGKNDPSSLELLTKKTAKLSVHTGPSYPAWLCAEKPLVQLLVSLQGC